MRMASIPKERSLYDMHDLEEFRDIDYCKIVLGLNEKSEHGLDEELSQTAAALGIKISPPTGHSSISESAVTLGSSHTRTASTGSQASISTTATSRTSVENSPRRRSSTRRSLSFSEYDKYVEQVVFLHPIPADPAPSLFSISTKKSYSSLKSGLRQKLRLRKSKVSLENVSSCVCCRDDFEKNRSLQTLPCEHKYCEKCVRVLIQQASTEESKMPPKCCSRAVPGSVIKSVLTRDEQVTFMKSVQQYSTPWEARVFCPLPGCGAFIAPRTKIDPKHPFTVTCRKCRTKVCSTCKREAHQIGQDCPADWELDVVLKMGESQGWRRCYKCRTLVELTQGCSHITCRCKAQFCYICGAVWDPDIGCPNYCNGDEELDRRRAEEEARVASLEAEKAAQEAAEAANQAELEAERKRTAESSELNELRKKQVAEKERFIIFERKMKWLMWTRHGEAKLDMLDKYGELQAKMQERHSKTGTHLEDRQVAAEMELRATLKQAERSVQIRLRHMEAYCDGLGRGVKEPAVVGGALRVVTERDLRELGQQYNLRDNLERLHQAKINVMREKQAKQMEQLLMRQEEELERLRAKQEEDLDGLEELFGDEEDEFHVLFLERKARLRSRWEVQEEIERRRLMGKKGVSFAKMDALEWADPSKRVDMLESVME